MRVRPLIEEILRADTHQHIAERLGPGWTMRQVDFAVETVKMTFAPEYMNMGPTLHIYARMHALRIAMGLDPCWCEA